jgi:hypothetical protein
MALTGNDDGGRRRASARFGTSGYEFPFSSVGRDGVAAGTIFSGLELVS